MCDGLLLDGVAANRKLLRGLTPNSDGSASGPLARALDMLLQP
jgi:hypothetical protein